MGKPGSWVCSTTILWNTSLSMLTRHSQPIMTFYHAIRFWLMLLALGELQMPRRASVPWAIGSYFSWVAFKFIIYIESINHHRSLLKNGAGTESFRWELERRESYRARVKRNNPRSHGPPESCLWVNPDSLSQASLPGLTAIRGSHSWIMGVYFFPSNSQLLL